MMHGLTNLKFTNTEPTVFDCDTVAAVPLQLSTPYSAQVESYLVGR